MNGPQIICPQCQKTFSFKAHYAGKTGRCSNCGNRFEIPARQGRTAFRTATDTAANRKRSIFDIEPYEFEQLVGTLLRSKKLTAVVQKPGPDGGIDIVAHSNEPFIAGKYVVQCKRYGPRNKVSVSVVRDLYGVVTDKRANKGILVTTSDFTKAAVDFAAEKNLELINGEKLSILLRHADMDESFVGEDKYPQSASSNVLGARLRDLAGQIDAVLQRTNAGGYTSRFLGLEAFCKNYEHNSENLIRAIQEFSDAITCAGKISYDRTTDSALVEECFSYFHRAVQETTKAVENVCAIAVDAEYSLVKSAAIRAFCRVLWDMSAWMKDYYECQESAQGNMGAAENTTRSIWSV